jgi:hypothetical protein
MGSGLALRQFSFVAETRIQALEQLLYRGTTQ